MTDQRSSEGRSEQAAVDSEEPSTGETEESSELPLDVVFDLLSSERRRRTIDYLRNATGAVELSELAEHIASLENEKPVDELTSSERKRVYVGLYQAHLPKMDSAGVLEFDRDRGEIRLHPRAGQLFRYLDMDAENQKPGSPGAGGEATAQRQRGASPAELREMAEELRAFADRLEDLS